MPGTCHRVFAPPTKGRVNPKLISSRSCTLDAMLLVQQLPPLGSPVFVSINSIDLVNMSILS